MGSAFDASLRVRDAADYADFLLPHLADDFRVLDVGCGQGTIALALAERVAHVVAVDSATAGDLDAMSRAWLEWSKSPDAYLGFAWCRALGWKSS